MFHTVPYTTEYKKLWNQQLSESPNSNFIFNREYMDYHSDRCTDRSMIVFENNTPVALFPANIDEKNNLFSHKGLTFGGLIPLRIISTKSSLLIFKSLLSKLKELGIETVWYRPMPQPFRSFDFFEEEYALYKINAKLIRREMTSSIKLYEDLRWDSERKREVNVLKRKGEIHLKKSNDCTIFWEEVLKPNLNNKFGANPIHTIEEFNLLMQRFPEKIELWEVWDQNNILAGMTFFISNQVAHAQHTSATPIGKKTKVLSFLISEKMRDYKEKGISYFNLGTSSEDGIFDFNWNLLFWKKTFGAIGYKQDTYLIELSNLPLLDFTNLIP